MIYINGIPAQDTITLAVGSDVKAKFEATETGATLSVKDGDDKWVVQNEWTEE